MLHWGDTLHLDGHLVVIISDPIKDSGRIVLAALTTRESWKDDACVLYPDDHPFITHDTCIDYANPGRWLTLSGLLAKIDSGEIAIRERMSPDVMGRIMQGASDTKHMPMDLQLILDDQGFFS